MVFSESCKKKSCKVTDAVTAKTSDKNNDSRVLRLGNVAKLLLMWLLRISSEFSNFYRTS